MDPQKTNPGRHESRRISSLVPRNSSDDVLRLHLSVSTKSAVSHTLGRYHLALTTFTNNNNEHPCPIIHALLMAQTTIAEAALVPALENMHDPWYTPQPDARAALAPQVPTTLQAATARDKVTAAK